MFVLMLLRYLSVFIESPCGVNYRYLLLLGMSLFIDFSSWLLVSMNMLDEKLGMRRVFDWRKFNLLDFGEKIFE